MSANATIEIEPLISYPRKAQVGKSYVMTVDLRQAANEAEWPYDAEEYTIHFMLDSVPLFSNEAIGDPSVVLHRFGGTYGPATFLLTASQEEMQGKMRLTLVNDSGFPVDVIEIPGIEVTKDAQVKGTSGVWITKETEITAGGRVDDDEVSSVTLIEAGVDVPAGFRLLRTLNEPTGSEIGSTAWSPDGQIIAVLSTDVQLWGVLTGELISTITPEKLSAKAAAYSPDGMFLAVQANERIEIFETRDLSHLTAPEHQYPVSHFAWSPDSKALAFHLYNTGVEVWDVVGGLGHRRLETDRSTALCVTWSPDGKSLATGHLDGTVTIWNSQTFTSEMVFEGHGEWASALAWAPDGSVLASGAIGTIRIWDSVSGIGLQVIEAHGDTAIISLSFCHDGRLLASKSTDGVIKLWRRDTWVCVATLHEHTWDRSSSAFHPSKHILATLDKNRSAVHIWELDVELLLSSASPEPLTPTAYSYSTAKVVLLGDSGSGKSALAQRLVSNAFKDTHSTHGYHVWPWKSDTTTNGETTVTRDIFLWDFAGQANYRLLHPLHLTGVSVALITFDARHQNDAFTSVRYWDAALRHAQRAAQVVVRKILVATRSDIGGVDREEVESLAHELGFDAYCETSAKNGSGLDELAESIGRLIDWEQLTRSSAPIFYKYVRNFIVSEKGSGRVMGTLDDFYQAFHSSFLPTDYDEIPATRPYFDSTISSLENFGLLMRLGDYILLQIELIDTYASAIVNTVRNDHSGLGAIREEDVLECRFPMPSEERIENKEHEKVIIGAVVDVFLRSDIALSIDSEVDSYLVFPSLLTRENADIRNQYVEATHFVFDGVIQTIWATLYVRLYRGLEYTNIERWRNAATFTTTDGSVCGLALQEIQPQRGELTLLFSSDASDAARSHFEALVHRHLLDQAIPDSVTRYDIVTCSNCSERLSDTVVQKRIDRGLDWINCPVCDTRIVLAGANPLSRSQSESLAETATENAEPVSTQLKVYISSPFGALQEYRQAVLGVLQKLGHQTFRAEEMNAVKSQSFDWMRNTIAECDVYICILAWYRGYMPDQKEGRTIIELEYEAARELKKPILVFLRDPMTDAGQYESSRELESFRERLSSENICAYFTSPEDLVSQVTATLARFVRTEPDSAEERLTKDNTLTVDSLRRDDLLSLGKAASLAIHGLETEPKAHEGLRHLAIELDKFFQDIQELAIYNGLHDELHQLDMAIIAVLPDLVFNVRRDLASENDLLFYAPRIRHATNELEHFQNRIDLKLVALNELIDGLHGLAVEIEETDVESVERFLDKVARDLKTAQYMTNKEVLHSYDVPRLLAVLETLKDLLQMMQLHGKSQQLWSPFEKWISVLRELYNSLQMNLEKFEYWFEIRAELEKFSSDPRAAESGLLVKSLKKNFEGISITKDAFSLESLKIECSKLESAVANGDSIDFTKSIRHLRRLSSDLLYQSSQTLLSMCELLQTGLEPLKGFKPG